MVPERRDSRTPRRAGECPRRVDAVAWLQGEFDDEEHASFTRHVEACPDCRGIAVEARRILGALQAPRRRRALRWTAGVGTLAAAATVLLAVSSGETPSQGSGATSPVVESHAPLAFDARLIAWMESRLGADGTWDRAALSRFDSHQVGMHSLALLALTRAAAVDPQPARLERIARAAAWLREQQDTSGLIGRPLQSGRFDHPVATMALLESWRLTGREPLRDAAERAVRHMADEQALDVRGPDRNPGHAAWVVGALARARQLGCTDLGGALARGQARLGPGPAWDLDGDCLDQGSFWTLALGPNREGPELPADDLYSTSVALLAAR